MERIKNMSLKKSFFCLTVIFLLIALVFSILSILCISGALQKYGTKIELSVDGHIITVPPNVIHGQELPFWYWPLSVMQIVLPVIFVIAGLLSADIVFYRMKLKKPLVELQNGAMRIMQSDLDFSIQFFAKDELGELSTAFESMRDELLKSNKELWRQMDERKRLNAAFSHDLRNPVTVLKGSAQMLKKGLPDDKTQDTVRLIEEYANRIETYVEAMSSAQKLEELSCNPAALSWESLTGELCDSLSILGNGTSIDIKYDISGETKTLWVDKSIVLNVAENLLANAIRYAKNEIDISISCNHSTLTVFVQDDGPGFSDKILNKGAEPFLRGEETAGQTEHFGMGLYVCRLLCEKHGGALFLRNTEKGASVTATFLILKP